MSVAENTEDFISFNGHVFRQIGEPGMTTFGYRRKDKICMVYENPVDFLTLMEQVERNGVHAVMSRRYHIILNGKRGICDACDYLKAHPDFMEIRTFIPRTESGDKYFSAINDAVKGTAIDRSDMFGDYLSLFDKYYLKVPESYHKWKAAKEMEAVVSEKRDVRQQTEKPRIVIKQTLGGEKSAVIDGKERGLKLWSHSSYVEFGLLCKMCFCLTFRCRSRLKKHPCKGKTLDPICMTDSLWNLQFTAVKIVHPNERESWKNV